MFRRAPPAQVPTLPPGRRRRGQRWWGRHEAGFPERRKLRRSNLAVPSHPADRTCSRQLVPCLVFDNAAASLSPGAAQFVLV